MSQGIFAMTQACPLCGGSGTVIEDPCKACGSSGKTRALRKFSVPLPAGVKDGTKIKLKGKGEPGARGGPPGDLYVIAQVDESPVFERRGADLVVEVPVTMVEAALGATVKVPTPEGSVGLKIPAGTQHGKMLKMKGKGAPRLGASGKGDLLARVKVLTPGEAERGAERPAEEVRRRPQGRSESRTRGLVGLEQRWSIMAARTRTEETKMPFEDKLRPVFMISVAAELAEMHPQTLRMYERRGLIRPSRSSKSTRLYSLADVERLRRIQQLVADCGLNLAGVERVLEMEQQMESLQRRLDVLQADMDRLAAQAREDLEAVHRSYRKELVPLSAPGAVIVVTDKRRGR